MAPVTITNKVLPQQIQGLAMQGKPTEDYTATPASWTVTFVVTPGDDDDINTAAVTVDYSST